MKETSIASESLANRISELSTADQLVIAATVDELNAAFILSHHRRPALLSMCSTSTHLPHLPVYGDNFYAVLMASYVFASLATKDCRSRSIIGGDFDYNCHDRARPETLQLHGIPCSPKSFIDCITDATISVPLSAFRRGELTHSRFHSRFQHTSSLT